MNSFSSLFGLFLFAKHTTAQKKKECFRFLSNFYSKIFKPDKKKMLRRFNNNILFTSHPLPPSSIFTNKKSITLAPRPPNPGHLGRSLYRRILKELRATRNYDHHLRDIRFLLWVPGTKGKRQYDELKRLAQMNSSLHPSRKKDQHQQSTSQDETIASATTSEENIRKKIINTSPSIADQIRAVAGGLFRKERDRLRELDESLELEKTVFLESLLAKSKEIKQGKSSCTTSLSQGSNNFASLQAQLAVNKATQIQEGSKRAFWAIKRLQDIRAGVVPNASMWLATTSSVAPPTPFSLHHHHHPHGNQSNSPTVGLGMIPQNTPYLAQYQMQQQQQLAASGGTANTSLNIGEEFDPFLIPKDAQMRGGNFPFLHEFLGLVVGENNKELLESLHLKKLRREGRRRSKKKQILLQQQQQEKDPSSLSSAESEESIIEEYLDTLDTHGKSENKVLKLELVSRCACVEGSSARYHLSFRLENISEFAVDVKLAHLFAVQCQSPSLLSEMVCLLPLFGNSILSPYSVSAFDQDPEDEEVVQILQKNNEQQREQDHDNNSEQQDNGGGNELNREILKSVRRKRGKIITEETEESQNETEQKHDEPQQQEQQQLSEAPHHEFVRKTRQMQKQQQEQKTKEAQYASLPYLNHTKSSNRTSPEFSAKPRAPDHCAVYDVSFPVQGECVLRGFILYRTISNSFPNAAAENDDSTSPQQQQQHKTPSTVKSRLKVLHLPLIKLSPPDS